MFFDLAKVWTSPYMLEKNRTMGVLKIELGPRKIA